MPDAFDLPETTAIVCHDAGAANVIVAGLKRIAARRWSACMLGPAARIWETAFGAPAPCSSVEDALRGADFLLSGTGWASDTEHDSRLLARKAGIRSAALLDHWVNYPMRFERNHTQVLPDELWVSDDDALRLARNAFPELPVHQVENWYLRQQLAEIDGAGATCADELLYIAEPMRDDWHRGTAGEFQALDFFAGKLPHLGLPAGIAVRLRPHPSDAPGKYNNWIAQHDGLRVVIDDSPSMAAALGRARWVAGCESYGLVLALAAGRTVYCTLPPWAPACRLPHSGLVHLATMSE